MAKVPDLGSDFAQKLLKDLRRRRERLGFESSAAAQRGAVNAACRDTYSSSQRPQQAGTRGGRAESTTNRPYRQGYSSIAGGARKPRNHGAPPPIAHSQAIVPFQGGASKPKPAANVDVDMQMALALALSNRGKLQNIQLVESNGGNYLLSSGAHVGKVAIGVQKLNDILMAYTSGAGARGFGRRGSVEVGKQLLRGAMDLEESLNMLMMLQEASDYMGSSGNGKVLLLEGKESRRSSSRSPSSARLVEIVDEEDPEAELGSHAKSSSDASMQIVPLRKSQGSSANHRSALQLTTVTNSSKNNVTSTVAKDDSKVRMPNLIAKLMGLENLPSAKVVAERKAAETFVRPHAVPRKAAATTDAAFGTLPIRIVRSGVTADKGHINNFMARAWNMTLTKSEESECASVLSNRPSHLTADKQPRQTMRQGFSKQDSTDRRVAVTQSVDEKPAHRGMKPTEESKLQKTVGVGCRSDRKMNFLQRFRKNAKSKPVAEEKDIIQGSIKKVGKMQASGTKQSGLDREVKSRRMREKFNKENVSSAENKPEVRNGKTEQLRSQAQSKQANGQIVVKRPQNYRQMQSETGNQILEHKRTLKSEAVHSKEKIDNTLIQLMSGQRTKVDDTGGRKPSNNMSSNDAIFRESAEEMKDTSTSRGGSLDQSEKQLPEEVNGPITSFAQTGACSTADTTVDGVNQTASEATRTVEIFYEVEQQQQQQQQQLQLTKDVDDPPRNDSDNILKSSNPRDLENRNTNATAAMPCDSFTETQLLLKEMLLKDHYLLETARSLTRIHLPVIPTHATTGKWLDKGNKVLADVGREILRRKGKRAEAMADACTARPATLTRLRTLDDLVRELDADVQSLDIPGAKPLRPSDGNGAAELLKLALRGDVVGARPDANSVWDFGWSCVRDLPVEKNDVVRDLERSILGGIITDVARELIGVSRCQGWCACEA